MLSIVETRQMQKHAEPERIPRACAKLLCCLFRLERGSSSLALLETVEASCGVENVLLSGVERVACRTDFHVELCLGRADFVGRATYAGRGSLGVIGWVNVFLHGAIIAQPSRFSKIADHGRLAPRNAVLVEVVDVGLNLGFESLYTPAI